jgi:hypothetical protein
MTTNAFRALGAGLAVVMMTGCGPLRLDNTARIRGSVVAVRDSVLSVRHKTGRTYDIRVTPDTRLRRDEEPLTIDDLCPGVRAIVTLSAADRARASEVAISGRQCP